MKTVPIVIVSVLIIIIVGLGMIPTIVPWLMTPQDRVYTGIHGFSSDYIGYVSYIKEGMYGRYSMLLRPFPFPQPVTPIHFFYIAIGIIANMVFIHSAPFAYHVSRLMLGIVFVFICFRFFLLRFPKPTEAALVTFLAFVSSPFFVMSRTAGSWVVTPLKYFNFYIEAAGRVSERPHYVFGEIVFLFLVLLLFRASGEKHPWMRSPVLFFTLSFVMTMVHSGSGIIALSVFLVWFLIDRRRSVRIVAIVLGAVAALAISYWSILQFSMMQELWLDFYAYAGAFSLLPLLRDFVSFGPTLMLALVGLLFSLCTKKNREKLDILVLVWLVVQMGLFFYGYRWFHADSVRFLQSLYFIPFAYGTAILFKRIATRFGKSIFLILMSAIILYSLPPFIMDFVHDVFSITDYRGYGVFAFPTKNQWNAYGYLDRHTPKESIVLAKYEAANNILIASHNRVIGNNQQWGVAAGLEMYKNRDNFFSGGMKEGEARDYLIANHIDYVYYGYQEMFVGNMRGYSFLRPVFTNPEVTIFALTP